jgi:MFS family permease
MGFKIFVLSAGSLPYPVTFLATDLLSEIYGHRRANRVVWVGFLVSMFVLAALWLGSLFPAIAESPVSDEIYMTSVQERLARDRRFDDGLPDRTAHRREDLSLLEASDAGQAHVAAQQRLDGRVATGGLGAGGAGAVLGRAVDGLDAGDDHRLVAVQGAGGAVAIRPFSIWEPGWRGAGRAGKRISFSSSSSAPPPALTSPASAACRRRRPAAACESAPA